MTDSYISLYQNSNWSSLDPSDFLTLMFLFLGRMTPIIVLVPFFGAKMLPGAVKIVLALSLFVVLLPQLLFVAEKPIHFDFNATIYLFKEIFIGLLIGFMLSLPFFIVQTAGMLIDNQRGGSSLMINDPTMQNQSSPLGTLFNLVLIYLFFRIDGPFTVIEIVSTSYTALPPDKLLSGEIFHADSPIYNSITHILGHVMILGTQMATPALIMILMTDFFLGIANRLAPQVQISFLGMPLKSLLALVVVFFGWSLFNEESLFQVRRALQNVALYVHQLIPTNP